MIVCTDPDYLDTKLVKQGVKRLPPAFQELREWIEREYGTPILSLYYDEIEFENNRPRLRIIFEFDYEPLKLCNEQGSFDSQKQQAVSNKLKQITGNSSNHPLSSTLSRLSDAKREILIIFESFEPIAREEVNGKIPQAKIDQLQQEFGRDVIWKILREFAMTTFLLFTDDQVEQVLKSGDAEKFKAAYLKLLKEHDEFDYFKPETNFLAFDSKQNFDSNYDSNWFHFSRR